MNIVVLQGTLSSEPTERTLPSGRNVLNWDLTTNTPEGRSSVPVQWDEPSQRVCDFVEGDELVVLGRVRRRFFRSGGATAARTEVLATRVAKRTQTASVGRLLDQARDDLAS